MNLLNNFIHILKRFKVSSILNILGLSVAFAAFLIIVIQVKSEYGFEDCHSKAERIYRVDKENKKTGDIFGIIQPRPLIEEFIHSTPEVEKGSVLLPYASHQYFIVNNNNLRKGYKEDIVLCSPDITEVFDFDMLEGQSDCLSNPQNIIIPESIAKHIFGEHSALGRQIELQSKIWMKESQSVLIVGGVFRDFPDNTQLDNRIYTAIDNDAQMKNWVSNNFIGYVLLDENADPDKVAASFNNNFDYASVGYDDEHIKLTPLKTIYFRNESQDGMIIKSANPATPKVLISIGILIMVIAAINYMNFNMALAPRRIKSINTRKVLGGSDMSLRLILISEGIIICCISLLLAVVIVYILHTTKALVFIRVNINPFDNGLLVLLTGAIAVMIGIIASLRPAYYYTSFSPALVLKGSFGLPPSGKRLRMLLVGFQFFVSIVLIISSAFIYKQNNFMQKYSLGYDSDNVVFTELSQNIWENDKKTLITQLKNNTDILDVAFAQQKLGASDDYRQEGLSFNEQDISFYYLPVSWNFTQIMGINIIEGRPAGEYDETDWSTYYKKDENIWNAFIQSKRYLIINKQLSNTYNIKPGDFVFHMGQNVQVLGVVDNIKLTSLRKIDGNMAFAINDPYPLPAAYAYIRIKTGADVHKTIKYIETTLASIDPVYPVKVEFFDDVFDNLYKRENNMGEIITLFSLLAIIISVAGVFGVVMFECEYKQKEIAVRKIMGSTEIEILSLFNSFYIKIFAICFVMAIPVAYYIINKWLENFAYKTSVDWWIFILAGLPVLATTMLTVSLQAWRAATVNPVESLKNE